MSGLFFLTPSLMGQNTGVDVVNHSSVHKIKTNHRQVKEECHWHDGVLVSVWLI